MIEKFLPRLGCYYCCCVRGVFEGGAGGTVCVFTPPCALVLRASVYRCFRVLGLVCCFLFVIGRLFVMGVDALLVPGGGKVFPTCHGSVT